MLIPKEIKNEKQQIICRFLNTSNVSQLTGCQKWKCFHKQIYFTYLFQLLKYDVNVIMIYVIK